jgi:exodeoxyribonuclease VII large subunit
MDLHAQLHECRPMKTPELPAAARLSAADGTPPDSVYSVSRLNRAVRGLLESGLGPLWVEGEISNLARPSSGHWYFSLKDREAQVRCAMFRQRNVLSRCTPREGQLVHAFGRVSVYEPRGDYQLLIEALEDAGTGALQRAFEELKTRLDAEGLFALEHKRALPAVPRRIGVITSPSGAAIRDILHVLARRFPAAPVLLYPVPVQGAAAVPGILAALELAAQRAECDVLILARGGGSLEDLWAFNDERVARAMYRCPIPIVTGIGHEVDVTIADFVADVRAPTPTGAAQLVVPDSQAWRARLAQFATRLQSAARRTLRSETLRVAALASRLQQAHPGARLRQHSQRLDELEVRLRLGIQARLARVGAALELAARALQAVSPLATLARGFAVVTRERDGVLLTAADQVATGESVLARLGTGNLRATVTERLP